VSCEEGNRERREEGDEGGECAPPTRLGALCVVFWGPVWSDKTCNGMDGVDGEFSRTWNGGRRGSRGVGTKRGNCRMAGKGKKEGVDPQQHSQPHNGQWCAKWLPLSFSNHIRPAPEFSSLFPFALSIPSTLRFTTCPRLLISHTREKKAQEGLQMLGSSTGRQCSPLYPR
jgi:hypothetical protein